MKINKKIMGILLGAVAITSCSTMGSKSASNMEKYKCETGHEVVVKYEQDGKVANVKVGEWNFPMMEKRAASGAYYEGEKGVSFHTKNGEAIANFGNGDVSCKIVK